MYELDRRALLGTALFLTVAGFTGPALAQADIGRASNFIQTTGQELVAAINDQTRDLQARRQRVAAVLRRSVERARAASLATV